MNLSTILVFYGYDILGRRTFKSKKIAYPLHNAAVSILYGAV